MFFRAISHNKTAISTEQGLYARKKWNLGDSFCLIVSIWFSFGYGVVGFGWSDKILF